MLTKAEIENVHISLVVNEEQVLALRVSKSGALNRMGDGSDDPKMRLMFMKRIEEPLFDRLMEILSLDLLSMVGRYTFPDPKGDITQLLITLEGEKDTETGYEFVYGSDSEGPPEEIIDFVEYAVELSDPYWEDFLSRKLQGSKKP
ncbi:MAG: hypothetical protein R8P61_18575 [Bacteroidia bacterium]|nr:hypothetical protein [Bacteroidia bacterium]